MKKNDETILTAMPFVANIGDLSTTIESAIVERRIDSIEAYTQLIRLKKVIDNVLGDARVQNIVIERLQDEGEQSANRCTLSLVERGVKYDYASCGHYRYNQLAVQKKAIEQEMKGIEAMLKTIADEEIADANTGEILQKPTKTSTLSINTKILD